MSYVRWSSKVRSNCAACGDAGRVAMDPSDPSFEILSGSRLCPACSSCWYIYWDVGGYISVHHSCDSSDDVRLPFEDAANWKPPESCPMGDVALRAVADAVEDWKSSQEEPAT